MRYVSTQSSAIKAATCFCNKKVSRVSLGNPASRDLSGGAPSWGPTSQDQTNQPTKQTKNPERQRERKENVSANSRFDRFLDEHYPDEYMDKIFANKKEVNIKPVKLYP